MDFTSIVVAALVAIPATIAAIATLRGNKVTKENATILNGNGKGNVMQMLETVLRWQGEHASDDAYRFARLEDALAAAAFHAASNASTAATAAAVAAVADGDARDARG